MEDDSGSGLGLVKVLTVVVVQIAGMLARRIVFKRAVGDWVERGERIGAITFGSQVDLYLGPEAELLVRCGQRVKGGATPVARQRASGQEGVGSA